MTEPKTIAEAINDVTDDDADLEESTEETTSEEAAEEESGSLLDEDDEEDADEEGDGAAEDEEEETARTGDVEGEVDEDGNSTAKPDDEPDIFDTLTPEEIAAIKADPALNKLRKSLMRGFSDKTSKHSHLVQLGLAYQRDPKAVAQAIADSIGLKLVDPTAAGAPAAAAADPGVELEQLFGPQIGPKVRAVFDKWAEARIGPRVAPLEQTLGKVTAESEAARMYGEEQAFKAKHKDVTPAIEREIVALGSSGKIVPGDMTPAEYLETLYDVVMARRARQAAKTATKDATTKLARKIDGNRRDREPSGVSGRAGSVKKVSRIPEARSISEALDLAMAELEAEQR